MKSGCSAFWVSAGSYQIKSKLLPTPCWVGWLSLRSRQHHALPQWHAPVLRSTQQQHALQAGQIADGRLGRGVGGGVVQSLHQLQVAPRGNVRDGERDIEQGRGALGVVPSVMLPSSSCVRRLNGSAAKSTSHQITK